MITLEQLREQIREKRLKKEDSNLRNRKKSKKDKEIATPYAKLSNDKGVEPGAATESVESVNEKGEFAPSNQQMRKNRFARMASDKKDTEDTVKRSVKHWSRPPDADDTTGQMINRGVAKVSLSDIRGLADLRRNNLRKRNMAGDPHTTKADIKQGEKDDKENRKYDRSQIKNPRGFAKVDKMAKSPKSINNSVKYEAVNPHDDDGANHIAMQMRKVVSLRGMRPVEFKDGKKVRVEVGHAQKWLTKYNRAKPLEKEKMQSMAQKSHGHFKKSLDENVFKSMAGAVSGAVKGVKDAFNHAQTNKHLTNMVNMHRTASKAGGPDAEKHAQTANHYASALHHHDEVEGDPSGKKRNSYINSALNSTPQSLPDKDRKAQKAAWDHLSKPSTGFLGRNEATENTLEFNEGMEHEGTPHVLINSFASRPGLGIQLTQGKRLPNDKRSASMQGGYVQLPKKEIPALIKKLQDVLKERN